MSLQNVAIVGIYASQQARRLDVEPTDLVLECVAGALVDAGLTPRDVDGAAIEWPGPGQAPGSPSSWAVQLGVRLGWVGDSIYQTAGIRGLIQAASAVATGQCETVVIGGGMAGSADRRRFATVGGSQSLEFFDTWGGYVAPSFAMVAQRHMHDYGTTPEQLAQVAATIRNHGHVNPEAVMYGRGPYSVADVLASPPIASPLHLLDICLVAQGGAAIVLTTLERARDLRRTPVTILGAAQEIRGGLYVQAPTYRDDGDIGALAAQRALGMAGVGLDDIHVFNLYDPTSFEVIRQLETLGFCKVGEGGPFVSGGAIAADGRYPLNLDGGCLSYAWNGLQQMTLKVIESVRQLRGEAGCRQTPGARLALSAVGGPGAQKYEICVLGRT